MATALAGEPHLSVRTLVGIGTHRVPDMPASIEWHESAHPVPDARSVVAAERALAVAAAVDTDECLVLLLSGGASALMAAPIAELPLAVKQQTIEQLLRAGADIQALNTVRKHLSRIKGGRLAASCRGATLTLAISDVVGDDLSVIGSGPGVGDPTTWDDVASVIERFGTSSAVVRQIVERGRAGRVADTPRPDSPELSRAHARVIASRRHALDAAHDEAESRGYRVIVHREEVTGEARAAAPAWLTRAMADLRRTNVPHCVLSAGETTVTVRGRGRGGRNQEFVLALTDALASVDRDIVVASIGSDGIDGPTDAAGALADRTTRDRAALAGQRAAAFLADNNAYEYFATLGDLIHLGRTDTNVGDLQVLLSV